MGISAQSNTRQCVFVPIIKIRGQNRLFARCRKFHLVNVSKFQYSAFALSISRLISFFSSNLQTNILDSFLFKYIKRSRNRNINQPRQSGLFQYECCKFVANDRNVFCVCMCQYKPRRIEKKNAKYINWTYHAFQLKMFWIRY